VIDKLDLRIPTDTPFAPEMADLIHELKYGSVGPFVPSRYYQYCGDLRNHLGIDARVNLHCRNGEHDHKLEIIDAGTKTLSEMKAIPSRVFQIDPTQLEVMRIDLAADVTDVPVPWFRQHARFQYKQFASSIEKSSNTEIEFIAMGSAVAQSLYAGRRPNCVRIYNKIAELRKQWLQLKRTYERYNKGLLKWELTEEQKTYALLYIPSFEEFCKAQGFDYSAGKTVTRIERQIGGDRIPEAVDRLAKLVNLPEFDPFSHLRVVARHSHETRPALECWEGSIRDYLAGIGLQKLISESGGVQTAFSIVTRFGRGNGKRVLDSLQAFLPTTDCPLSCEEITGIYRESVRKQVAA
jgi:hypothetical protein